MTSPLPKTAHVECQYCAALRRENAKHRLRHVAERDQMEVDFRAREAFLERENDRLKSEIAALRRVAPMHRRPTLASRGVQA